MHVRTRARLQILLTAGVICSAPSAVVARERCAADALEEWYCAAEPLGSAVVDNLGRVLCAPGACVKQDVQGDEREWLCSTKVGGAARAMIEGPECDGECRAPDAKECRKI